MLDELRLEYSGDVIGDLGVKLQEDRDPRLEEVGGFEGREEKLRKCRDPCLELAHGEVKRLYQSLLRSASAPTSPASAGDPPSEGCLRE